MLSSSRTRRSVRARFRAVRCRAPYFVTEALDKDVVTVASAFSLRARNKNILVARPRERSRGKDAGSKGSETCPLWHVEHIFSRRCSPASLQLAAAEEIFVTCSKRLIKGLYLYQARDKKLVTYSARHNSSTSMGTTNRSTVTQMAIGTSGVSPTSASSVEPRIHLRFLQLEKIEYQPNLYFLATGRSRPTSLATRKHGARVVRHITHEPHLLALGRYAKCRSALLQIRLRARRPETATIENIIDMSP
jgi:hypothetical protein